MAGINNLTTISQEQFLQLLSAQLQNQDPLNPVSDKDLVAQLTSVSTVSGITQLNASFAQMLQFQQLTGGSNLLGRTVEFATTSGNASGVVSAVNSSSDGTIRLTVGNQRILLSDVVKVTATP